MNILSKLFRVRWTSLQVLLLALFVTGSCAAQFNGPALPSSTGVNVRTLPTTDPAILNPTGYNVRLTYGDQITVRVFGPGDYSAVARVATDGKVQLPLIGVVSLQGLTVLEAENLIAQRLVSAGMYRDPQVTVQIADGPNATVSVIGEVHGVIPVVGSRRLLEVLAAAGNLPATASHIITINRPGVAEPITVDLGTDPGKSALANVPVFPGDVIITSRVGVVYVLGAFKASGVVPIVGNSPLTLLQVTALSGGPNFEGKFDDLRIIRTTGTQRSVVRVDIKRIMFGKDPDPVLQADDIIFLPDSTLKAAIKSGGIGTLFSITGLLVSVISLSR